MLRVLPVDVRYHSRTGLRMSCDESDKRTSDTVGCCGIVVSSIKAVDRETLSSFECPAVFNKVSLMLDISIVMPRRSPKATPFEVSQECNRRIDCRRCNHVLHKVDRQAVQKWLDTIGILDCRDVVSTKGSELISDAGVEELLVEVPLWLVSICRQLANHRLEVQPV